ncbi:hypothetical protein AEQ48_12405 [Pseudomonas libanensis]|uniref:Uncharacterized protein n=1 Tax=Pseudomonas libanensis TaxID=75588 RepID=A0ABR5M7N8_9PSED|nr:hypothetical protein AEQ48_12405 [Pseudomonas libanensis]
MIIDVAVAFQLLNRLYRHARLAGQFFAAPAQHEAGLRAVFGGELVQHDLLFYERAHCQRGHGGSPGSTVEAQLYCVFVQLFIPLIIWTISQAFQPPSLQP